MYRLWSLCEGCRRTISTSEVKCEGAREVRRNVDNVAGSVVGKIRLLVKMQ